MDAMGLSPSAYSAASSPRRAGVSSGGNRFKSPARIHGWLGGRCAIHCSRAAICLAIVPSPCENALRWVTAMAKWSASAPSMGIWASRSARFRLKACRIRDSFSSGSWCRIARSMVGLVSNAKSICTRPMGFVGGCGTNGLLW